MAMKFDSPGLSNSKVKIWINSLALIFLLTLAYVFFFKRYDVPKNAELNSQRLIFSMVKKNMSDEHDGLVNNPEVPVRKALRLGGDELDGKNSVRYISKAKDENGFGSANSQGRGKENAEVNDQADLQTSEYDKPVGDIKQQTSLLANTIDDGKPIIALIIGELGVSKSNIELGLPEEVTFGFSSYIDISSAYLNNQLLLNIPLQSVDYPKDDPGPQALLLENSEQENLNRLNAILNKKINYQGVYTPADENYTNSEKTAEFLLANLKQRNLIYLCGIADKNNLIYQIAKKIDFHILANDVILDDVISSEAINDKLIELENIAREQGSAIAVGSSYPLTIELLKQWIPSLKEKDIKILPIKDFYQITKMRKALLPEAEPNDIQ